VSPAFSGTPATGPGGHGRGLDRGWLPSVRQSSYRVRLRRLAVKASDGGLTEPLVSCPFLSHTEWMRRGGGGWSRRPGFRIVSVKQARRETGLTRTQLIELPRTELLTWVLPGGRTEEAIRLPVEPAEEKSAL
jgi:hypothetical protein